MICNRLREPAAHLYHFPDINRECIKKPDSRTARLRTIHQVFTSVHIEPPASNRRRALELLPPCTFLPVGVREHKRSFADLEDAYVRHHSRPQASQFNAEIERARRPHCDPFNHLIQAQPQRQKL